MKVNKAFTLIEIMLVVIIIGIVLAIAAPNFSKGYSHFQLNKTSDDLLTVSRWAQAMAIGQERIYVLSFSEDHHSYDLLREKLDKGSDDQDSFEPVNGSLGRMHMVPEAVELKVHEDSIKFYPDGTIDPTEIQLNSPGQKIKLSSTEVRGMLTKVDSE